MTERPIMMVREDEDTWMLAFGDSLTWYEAEDTRPPTEQEITTEAMSDMLDHAAESCNAHDFVMCHRYLAGLINRELGKDAAFKILRALVNCDGLHGLNGVCGKGPSESERSEYLGFQCVDGQWTDWQLPTGYTQEDKG